VIKRNVISIVLIFIIINVSTRVFGLKVLETGVFPYIRVITLFIFIVLSLRFAFSFKGSFVFPVQLIGVSILTSIIMAYHSWGQSFVDSLKATTPYLIWFIFFLLLFIKPNIKSIEKTIVFLGIVYIILYFYQFFNHDVVYFGWGEEIVEDRGVNRFILPGTGVLFLVTFLSINKLTTSHRNRFFWAVLSFIGLIIPFFQATRQFIFGVLVVFLYHFTLKAKRKIRILVLTLFPLVFYFLISNYGSIVAGLSESVVKLSDEGNDYIRILAAQYYIHDFSPNFESYVLGNGVPYGTKSEYGKFVSNTLQDEYYYYLADVGLIGLNAMFGVLSLIGYILIWVNSFKLKLPPKFQYLKYYLWFLLLTSLTSSALFDSDFSIFTIIVVYLYQIVLNMSNRNLQISSV
jgi:hypothetical protein